MSAADAGYGDWMPLWCREADDESADQNGHRSLRVPSGGVKIEYRVGGMSEAQRAMAVASNGAHLWDGVRFARRPAAAGSIVTTNRSNCTVRVPRR